MKKVQVPLLLPLLMTVVIVVLTGALVYFTYMDGDKNKEQPQAAKEYTTIENVNAKGVLDSLNNVKSSMAKIGAAKSSSIKGSCLLQAAHELDIAAAYCGSQEQNLKRFLRFSGLSIRDVGNKLLEGGEFTEADSNNLTELTGALDSTISTVARAVDEENTDYLRGEFSLPVKQISTGSGITREEASNKAADILEDAAFKEEKDYYYSFSDNGYVLEVSKKDGAIMYRRTDYESRHGELTAERLKELGDTAKTLLKDKGYGDMALMQWQAKDGELSLGFYPVAGGTVYMNAPFSVVVSIADGSLLGLKTSDFSVIRTGEGEKLLSRLKTDYKDNNYIVSAVNEYGVPCYLVSYTVGGTEYLSYWQILTEQEIKLSKIENNTYGRLIS